MRRINSNRAGFTLLELLISIAILGMLFGASFFVFSGFLRSETLINTRLDQVQSTRFAMSRILDEIRGAGSINGASSDSKLILDYDGFSVSYDYANGKVRRRKGGGSSYLTEPGKISSLGFEYPAPKLVKVILETSNLTFESQALVRN